LNTQLLNDLSNKIREMAKSSPLDDVEHNIRALLQGAFTKLELVSRQEFDVQADLLRVTRQKLDEISTHLEIAEKNLISLQKLLHKNNKEGRE